MNLTQEPGTSAWFLYLSDGERYRVSVIRNMNVYPGNQREFSLSYTHEWLTRGVWEGSDPGDNELVFPEILLAALFRAVGDAVGATESERLAAVGEVE